MKVYTPKYLPGMTIGIKSGNDFIISTIDYCRFNPDYGYIYHLNGFMGEYREDNLIEIPKGSYMNFEV